MGLISMSERDLKRIQVLAEVRAGQRTVVSAAAVLDLGVRQTFRLLSRYEVGGVGALIHQARGRASNRQLSAGIREYAVELVRTKYADFGPTLATEILQEKHSITIGRETLRRWLMADGIWLSRKQRKTFHQPRLRRERFGELVQIDGSDHRWFEDRGEPCTLLVFIDDATGRLMQLRFVLSESTDSYLTAVHGYVLAFGCPVAFYSDKHSVFRVNKPNAVGGSGMTQLGRALAELNIEIICANSSQAKGRVERVNRTLQDRLVKELRLANICDINAGNAFLPAFMNQFNERFAIASARPEDLHRSLSIPVEKLTDILCHREQRYVGSQLTLSYDRKRIILERNPLSEGLDGKYVDVYDFPDGRLEVRTKGLLLPYRVFSKDQRVSHTAIVENKRLGHALAVIKAQQDTSFTPKVNTNSQKLGYQKRGRNAYGPDYIEPAAPIADGPCRREQNSVGQEVANDRNLDRNKVSETVVEQQVELRECSVRSLEVRCQVPPLPYRVFEKDQKMLLTETVANKRLGQALAVAKRMQYLALPRKVNTNSQKLGYQKRGRQIYGPDYVPKIPVRSAKESPTPSPVEQTG
jgi:transposase